MTRQIKIFGDALGLGLPEDWEDRSMYTFVSPEPAAPVGLPMLARARSPRPNVVVTREANEAGSLEAYAQQQLAASEQQVPGFTLVREGGIEVGGRPAIERVFTMVAQNTTIQQIQVLVIAGEWAYCFTFSGLPSQFDAFTPAIRELLSSARFE